MTEKRFGEYHEDDKAVSLRNRSGTCGGGQRGTCRTVGALQARDYKGVGSQFAYEGKLIIVQDTTGTLSPGAHAGSYNGQDAYNDMLVTNHGIRNATDRRVHGNNESVQSQDEGLQGRNRPDFEGGGRA